jgi:hypothetical protein
VLTAVSELVSPESSLHVAYWEDVFVLVDNGRAPAGHYRRARDLVATHAAKYPSGVGILTIIPGDASPPSETVRKAMNEALRRIEGRIRCFCWVVEGAGFQGAMVRAICTGMQFFGRHPYPTHVACGATEALAWMLPHLDGGEERLSKIGTAVTKIAGHRTSGNFVLSF